MGEQRQHQGRAPGRSCPLGATEHHAGALPPPRFTDQSTAPGSPGFSSLPCISDNPSEVRDSSKDS